MRCYYHNDIDGRCAASIVAQFTGDRDPEDYFEVDYIHDLPLDKVHDFEWVYIVDYSFKENTVWQLMSLLDRGCTVVWIDHHQSSIDLINTEGFEWSNTLRGIRHTSMSGAALTYQYFTNCMFEDMPKYIQFVSDYDCWKYKFDPDTTHFKIGLETEEYDALDMVWINLADTESDDQMYDLIRKGALIKQYIDNDNTFYRHKYAYETEIAGLKCLVVNRKSNSWIFGEKYAEYPIVMVWAFNGYLYEYSIFSSDPDVNCAKIAESLGGGGHKGAAGFSSKELLFKGV